MNPLHELADMGQSIWQDDIRRDMLDDGTLEKRLQEWRLTGLTSNPSIFDKAIAGSDLYDDAIESMVAEGTTDPEQLFFTLAIEDLRRAADVFADVWEESGHTDGCVSLEVSPTLADDTDGTIEQAAQLHARAERPNLMIKIPGTAAGLPAITRTIADGIPVNVTLLFDVRQYETARDAWALGLEQRRDAGESLDGVASVASVFVSRWDVPGNERLDDEALHDKLGTAVAAQAYASYRAFLDSERWASLAESGASPMRLLFASTSSKTELRDTGYVERLAAPDTVNTLPQDTLEAFADHGEVGDPLPDDGGDAADDLAALRDAGIDVAVMAEELQIEGKQKFVDSWNSLLDSLRDQVSSAGG